MIKAKTLVTLPGVQHRFFTRQGGVSAGLYSSLNCGYGSGDLPENVRENRRRAAAEFALGEADLQTVHQIHSTDVLTVGSGRWSSPGAPKADGLVSDRPGVALGVLAADCAPVLMADAKSRVIGACHAGWRGAFTGITDQTIAAMEKLGARRENIAAVIGPCIGAASYEVGPEFFTRFVEADEANAAFFRPSTLRSSGPARHYMFDLAGYLVRRLARANVAVEATGHDTLAGEGDFFSYRRNTLNGVSDYGRGLSAIALAA